MDKNGQQVELEYPTDVFSQLMIYAQEVKRIEEGFEAIEAKETYFNDTQFAFVISTQDLPFIDQVINQFSSWLAGICSSIFPQSVKTFFTTSQENHSSTATNDELKAPVLSGSAYDKSLGCN